MSLESEVTKGFLVSLQLLCLYGDFKSHLFRSLTCAEITESVKKVS